MSDLGIVRYLELCGRDATIHPPHSLSQLLSYMVLRT